jgi:translation elongation factor EF-1beta
MCNRCFVILSFLNICRFKGEAKDLSAYGPAGSEDDENDEKKENEEDELDLFGSDDEVDDAAEKLKQQRLAEYQAKKANKPQVVAKSSILLDVKPWDDETNMQELEQHVRSIEMDGLVWGASKLIAVGYGIKKLQISCVVEDDKVGADDLEERIMAFEDHVQSMDIAAFNKI